MKARAKILVFFEEKLADFLLKFAEFKWNYSLPIGAAGAKNCDIKQKNDIFLIPPVLRVGVITPSTPRAPPTQNFVSGQGYILWDSHEI